MAKAKGKRNHRKEKLEFVQDYLPIRDLKNGIIETTDNRYIKILEIEPINFTLRSDEEQFNIISSFASWLKISPMRLQFKSIMMTAVYVMIHWCRQCALPLKLLFPCPISPKWMLCGQ